jgi:hypothetical protein
MDSPIELIIFSRGRIVNSLEIVIRNNLVNANNSLDGNEATYSGTHMALSINLAIAIRRFLQKLLLPTISHLSFV